MTPPMLMPSDKEVLMMRLLRIHLALQGKDPDARAILLDLGSVLKLMREAYSKVSCLQCGMPWAEHPGECYNPECEHRGEPHCHNFLTMEMRA